MSKLCPMHPGQRYDACRHCERARAVTEMVLANVKPVPGGSHNTERTEAATAASSRPAHANNSRLTAEQVRAVHEMRKQGMRRKDIALATGICEATVSNVYSGLAYNPRVKSKVSVLGGSQKASSKARRQHHAERGSFAGYGTGAQ